MIKSYVILAACGATVVLADAIPNSTIAQTTPIGIALITVVFLFLKHMAGHERRVGGSIDRNTDAIKSLEKVIYEKRG